MPVQSETPVALITYSTKPRGGVNHTLALGEALHARGHLAEEPGRGVAKADDEHRVAARV